MSFKKASLVAMLAASMTSAPVLAQTATSASPVAASARVGADMGDESELRRGGYVIPLLAIIAIILGILAATSGGNDPPRSP